MATQPTPPGYAPPPPPRSGCGCFGIGCGCAVVLALLCGGLGAYFVYMLKDSVTSDPVKVAALGQSIAELDMPQNLNPKYGMDLSFPGAGRVVKWAMYTGDDDGSMLMLMEFRLMNQDQAMGQVQASAGNEKEKMVVVSTQTEKFTIRGKETMFTIEELHPDGQPEQKFWRASGTFPGHEGTAMMLLQLPQSKYTLEQLKEIVASIK